MKSTRRSTRNSTNTTASPDDHAIIKILSDIIKNCQLCHGYTIPLTELLSGFHNVNAGVYKLFDIAFTIPSEGGWLQSADVNTTLCYFPHYFRSAQYPRCKWVCFKGARMPSISDHHTRACTEVMDALANTLRHRNDFMSLLTGSSPSISSSTPMRSGIINQTSTSRGSSLVWGTYFL